MISRIRTYAIALAMTAFALMVNAATPLTSSDPNWLGGMSSFKTTEGNDFWLTFMANNATDPDNNGHIQLMIYVISEQGGAEIIVEAGGNQIGNLIIPEGGGMAILDNIAPGAVYLKSDDHQTRLNRGVHVYAKDKTTLFSCYAFSEAGSGANTTRDAALILPTRALGKEYYIQTYPYDGQATEFALVVTEDNTSVTITHTAQTSKKDPAGGTISLSGLAKNTVYMVRSDNMNAVLDVDMSGSLICADKPIAVFQGNEATKIPFVDANSVNHVFEQALPIGQWGKEFYLGITSHASFNHYNVLAAFDDTKVSISNLTNPITLNAGQSLVNLFDDVEKLVNTRDLQESDVKITSDKPLMLNTYLTCGGENKETGKDAAGRTYSYSWGHAANAMMPGWEMRTKRMSFYTDTITKNAKNVVQHMYVQVVTKTSDISKLTLDGTPVPADSFKTVRADSKMSIANLELPERGKHILESSGDGFVGFVYTISSESRGYQYTLGFTPPMPEDSLYIENKDEVIMKAGSYDLEAVEGKGWYQRQWKEWAEGRLDTAIVCDSSTVKWLIESPDSRPVKSIDWTIYDVTDGATPNPYNIVKGYPITDSPGASDTQHRLEHQFILPEEPMDNRKQYYDYELQAIFHRDRLICDGEDLDTFRTVTRVTRIFNDTLWRAICMGDTLEFYYDSLYNQDDLSQSVTGEKHATKFAATKAAQTTTKWQHNVGLGKHTFTRSYESKFGCDSTVTLELFVCDTFRFVDTIHLCSNQDTLWHEKHFAGKDFVNTGGTRVDQWIYEDQMVEVKFLTDSCDCQKGKDKEKYLKPNGRPFYGCDSIYEVYFLLHKSYDLHLDDTLNYTEYPDSTYIWYVERNGKTEEFPINRYTKGVEWDDAKQAWVGNFGDTLYTKTCAECNNGLHGCDSINSISLIIPPTYYFNDTISWCRIHYDWNKHDTTYTDFRWYGHRNDTLIDKSGDYYDKHHSQYGADSIYHLHLIYSEAQYPLYDLVEETVCVDTVNRSFHWQSTDGVISTDTILQDGVGIFYYANEDRCDSVYSLKLTVLPSYFIITDTAMTEEQVFEWQVGDTTIYGGEKTPYPYDTLVKAGITYDTLYFQTTAVNGIECDSTHVLILRVGEVYRDTVDTFVCGQEPFYDWVGIDHEGNDSVRMRIPERNLPRPGETLFYHDNYKTVFGFDSTFVLRLYRALSHDSIETVHVCQSPGSTYTWERHEGETLYDKTNDDYITVIPADRYGHYLYVDSQHTDIYGCDSVWTLELYVDSVYHFSTDTTICQSPDNDFIWIGQDQDSILGTILTEHVGDYTYEAYYHTIAGCDSIWTLHLHIDTVYSTPVEVTPRTMCDNEMLEFYGQIIYGSKYEEIPEGETGVEVPEGDWKYEFDLFYTDKNQFGCDSVIQHHFIVYKTYNFVTKVSICRESSYEWRGKAYYSTGIYEEPHKTTVGGCDSIYVLELYVKPANFVPLHATICDNETFEHVDTLWYTSGKHTEFNTLVWKPGMTIPQTYTEVRFLSPDGCDSIIYQYYLTINKHYDFDTTATVCSGKTFYSEELDHRWESWVCEYDTNEHVLPFDTLLIDSLTTGLGCDSVFTLHAHVCPTFRHVEKETICGNDILYWRDSVFTEMEAGEYIFRDSFLTVDGCDSIFELQLRVNSHYRNEESATICADGDYYWRKRHLYDIEPGLQFFYDSLKTGNGCDSVFHLFLTVEDTTAEHRYDTICYGDTLVMPETGHIYTTEGIHKDTIVNEIGCRHFIYTHLALIPPTVPTVWANDPMCQDEKAFDLLYTYTSHFPIAYSLYFDSIGLAMGFEDMIDVPITEYTDPMVITIPIPYSDNDKTKYPRPGNYNIHLVLDNGICQHMEQDCYRDSSFVMSYPKWITEQRWGDVIAILNDQKNGGYVWSSYQWYQGETPLIGQTMPYLYMPTGLIVGEEYHVRLVREGETEEFPTCPIVAKADPIRNDITPTMGYLDVTPTCVVTGNPYIHIMSRKNGTYRITTSGGRAVKEGPFQPDVTQVEVPAVEGMYIVQLWSDATPEEPYRAIKIIVRDKCENCATPF